MGTGTPAHHAPVAQSILGQKVRAQHSQGRGELTGPDKPGQAGRGRLGVRTSGQEAPVATALCREDAGCASLIRPTRNRYCRGCRILGRPDKAIAASGTTAAQWSKPGLFEQIRP